MPVEDNEIDGTIAPLVPIKRQLIDEFTQNREGERHSALQRGPLFQMDKWHMEEYKFQNISNDKLYYVI